MMASAFNDTERYMWKGGVPAPYLYRDSGTPWGAGHSNHYQPYLQQKYAQIVEADKLVRKVDSTPYTPSMPFYLPRSQTARAPSKPPNAPRGRPVAPPVDITNYPPAPVYNPYLRFYYEPNNLASRKHREQLRAKAQYQQDLMLNIVTTELPSQPATPASNQQDQSNNHPPQPTPPQSARMRPTPPASRPISRGSMTARPAVSRGYGSNELDALVATRPTMHSRNGPLSSLTYYKGKLSEMASAGSIGAEKEAMSSLHLNRMR